MTWIDSNWRMSISTLVQPQVTNQPKGTYIIWGYGLFINRVGNFMNKRMIDCNGEEIF